MGLSGWTWNIFGIIVAAISGYVYLFVPRNGSPNTAMALFFFIGIVFIIIGVAKMFFSRSDDKNMMNALKETEKTVEQKSVEMPVTMQRQNKVEEALNKAMQEAQMKQAQQQNNTPAQKMHHSNSYHDVHQYNGPVYNPSSGTHTQHPVTAHTQTHHATHPIQNSEHGLRCKKCGNVNAGHAVYCHQCGNRLR